MIAAFIANRINAYVSGGMKPETAARFTMGELSAIYRETHFSRGTSGAFRTTPPPENLDFETAMKKADTAIAEIISKYPAPIKPRNIYRSSDAVKRAVAAGIGIKPFFAKSGDNDPTAYTTDLQQIAAMWNEGQRRFKACIRGRFLALGINRKPGKPDGLEAFYRIFPREILPVELQNLPYSYPCYVQTPSGGFHLYFKYKGPELKLRELAPSVDINEWQTTCPGSRREGGEYILYGELTEALPLYGLIVNAIEKARKEKEEHPKPRKKTTAQEKANTSGFEKMAEYARNPA